MQVHRALDQLPTFNNAVITIGTFDGVHKGHQQIISSMKSTAAQVGGETVILTFHPHPRKIVKGEAEALSLLNTLDEKIDLLSKQGIDHLVVIPFTKEFSEQTAEEYIGQFLVHCFHPHTIIIGYDHRFGHNRIGDFRLLELMAPQYQFCVQEIPEQVLDAIKVSSTRIRAALRDGQPHLAEELLGYRYFFEGKVVKGQQLGRTLGFPTANIDIEDPEKLIPADGVYACWAQVLEAGAAAPATPAALDSPATPSALASPAAPSAPVSSASSEPLRGMMSIGLRPTVDGKHRTIEVNLLDFSGDLYGKTLRITLASWLRPELKFDGLDALKAAIAQDKVDTINTLNQLTF
jgi:riboflavin kinase / FMN adenylyltransferase